MKRKYLPPTAYLDMLEPLDVLTTSTTGQSVDQSNGDHIQYWSDDVI